MALLVFHPSVKMCAEIVPHGTIDCYTDGSKMKNHEFVGYSCYCPKLELEIIKSLNSNASVYTAECAAIDEAMNVALDNKDCNILIFSS